MTGGIAEGADIRRLRRPATAGPTRRGVAAATVATWIGQRVPPSLARPGGKIFKPRLKLMN